MQFYFAYVREAHPVRTTKAPDPTKAGHGDIGRHETMASRAIAAGKCSSGLGIKMPILLDTMKNPAYAAYKGFPAGTHIIDLDGTIQYATRGPWGTTPKGAEVVLKKLLAALPKTPEEVITQWDKELHALIVAGGLGGQESSMSGPSGFTIRIIGACAGRRYSITIGAYVGGDVDGKGLPAWAKENRTVISLPHCGKIVEASIHVEGAPAGLKGKIEALNAKYMQRLVVLDQQAAAKKKAEAETKAATSKEKTKQETVEAKK